MPADSTENRPARCSRLIWIVWGLVVVTVGTVALFLCDVGKNVQVRIDTGELRYTFFGVTYERQRHSRTIRERILSATRLPPPVPAEWYDCLREGARGPIAGEGSESCTMVYRWYRWASAWSEVDPSITRMILDEIVSWLEGGAWRGTTNLKCMAMLLPISLDDSGTPRLSSGWRTNEYVEAYLRAKGYDIEEFPPPNTQQSAPQ